MKSITRRDFVKSYVAAGATLALPFSRVRGANDNIRVAVVGFRGQGGSHIGSFRGSKGARVVALCDVDENIIEGEVKKFKERNEKVAVYTDYRKMMEDKSIDVVSIATTNHWHSLMTVWACQESDLAMGTIAFVPADHR